MVSRCQINGRTESRLASDSSLRANKSAQSTVRRPHRSPRVRDRDVRSPVPQCVAAGIPIATAHKAAAKVKTSQRDWEQDADPWPLPARAEQPRRSAQVPGPGRSNPAPRNVPTAQAQPVFFGRPRITHRRTSEAASLQSLPAARDRAPERRSGRPRWPISPGRWSCNARCRRENPHRWR